MCVIHGIAQTALRYTHTFCFVPSVLFALISSICLSRSSSQLIGVVLIHFCFALLQSCQVAVSVSGQRSCQRVSPPHSTSKRGTGSVGGRRAAHDVDQSVATDGGPVRAAGHQLCVVAGHHGRGQRHVERRRPRWRLSGRRLRARTMPRRETARGQQSSRASRASGWSRRGRGVRLYGHARRASSAGAQHGRQQGPAVPCVLPTDSAIVAPGLHSFAPVGHLEPRPHFSQGGWGDAGRPLLIFAPGHPRRSQEYFINV